MSIAFQPHDGTLHDVTHVLSSGDAVPEKGTAIQVRYLPDQPQGADGRTPRGVHQLVTEESTLRVQALIWVIRFQLWPA